MVVIGMIFQYDTAEGRGLVMFADGQTREFGGTEWTDSANVPSVGQKVAYEKAQTGVKITAAGDEAQIGKISEEEAIQPEAPVEDETPDQEETPSHPFESVDECVGHYTARGFKLVKDISDARSRTVTLRMYTPAEYGEVVIKEEGPAFSVTLMMNGKTVVFGA